MSAPALDPQIPSIDLNVAHMMMGLLNSRADRSAFLRMGEVDNDDQIITFRKLHELIGSVAGGLQARGITKHSRVVIFVPMSLDLYVTLLAVFRLGAVAVFIEPWGGRRMIEQAARLVDANAFVGVPKSLLLRTLSPSLRKIGVTICTGNHRVPGTERLSDLADAESSFPVLQAAPVVDSDPALVTFTTGSTGAPKGTNRTHEILRAQHHALARQVPNVEDARVWTNLPVVTLHNLARGVETVLPPDSAQLSKPSLKILHQLVQRSKASILALSPAPLGLLTTGPQRAMLSSVKRIYTGGGPVTPKLLSRAQSVFAQAEIVALYGSTEAEPIAHASAKDVCSRRDAMRSHGGIFVGYSVEDVDVRIIRATQRPIELEDATLLSDWEVNGSAAGEIIVAGEHVNRDYWNNREAVRQHKIFDERGRVWHRTGDIARRDQDGGIWLLGRLGRGLNIKGRKRWALEIETPVTDLPEVEVAALCLPAFSGSDREFKNASAVLAVQAADGFTRKEATQAALRTLKALGLASQIEVRSLKRIPVDKRHGTKIDLAALQGKLKPENREDY